MKLTRRLLALSVIVLVLVSLFAGLLIYFINTVVTHEQLIFVQGPALGDATAMWAAKSNAISALAAAVGLLMGFISIYLLWGTFSATQEQIKILDKERLPSLMIKLENGEIDLKDPNLPEEVWFTIHNVSKGPAVITEICRRWQPMDGKNHPPAIDPKSPPEGDWVKSANLPIGPGNEIGPLRSQWYRRGVLIPPNNCFYFDGYIRFKDEKGNDSHIQHFAYVLGSGRLHIALPPLKSQPLT